MLIDEILEYVLDYNGHVTKAELSVKFGLQTNRKTQLAFEFCVRYGLLEETSLEYKMPQSVQRWLREIRAQEG